MCVFIPNRYTVPLVGYSQIFLHANPDLPLCVEELIFTLF